MLKHKTKQKHLNLWQNSISLRDKNPEETRSRRIIPEHNKMTNL
jgi:hypothetical protein